MKELMRIPYNEFDYLYLMDVLSEYKYPRDNISRMISSGEIIRVKKGVYVKGEDYRIGSVSNEILANIIYGPSYISLEYALSFYQIIPEKVETITSVTLGKKKCFETQFGRFSYTHLPDKIYYKGVLNSIICNARGSLMASPEKALFDFVYLQKGVFTKKKMEALIFESLRIDKNTLKNFDAKNMDYILDSTEKRSLILLCDIIKGLQ